MFFQGSPVGDIQRVDIHKKLSESEKLMKDMSQTWEEKLAKTGACLNNSKHSSNSLLSSYLSPFQNVYKMKDNKHWKKWV